jgi:Ulp1 family protease
MKTKRYFPYAPIKKTSMHACYLVVILGLTATLILWAVAQQTPKHASILISQAKASNQAAQGLSGEAPADLSEASMIASQNWNVPYGLLLGIANAESSLGTNWYGCQHSFNAWGIKGKPAESCNSHIKHYDSWIEAADDVARILRTYYLDEGKDTPERIVRKYVGRYSENWVRNVSNYYRP